VWKCRLWLAFFYFFWDVLSDGVLLAWEYTTAHLPSLFYHRAPLIAFPPRPPPREKQERFLLASRRVARRCPAYSTACGSLFRVPFFPQDSLINGCYCQKVLRWRTFSYLLLRFFLYPRLRHRPLVTVHGPKLKCCSRPLHRFFEPRSRRKEAGCARLHSRLALAFFLSFFFLGPPLAQHVQSVRARSLPPPFSPVSRRSPPPFSTFFYAF